MDLVICLKVRRNPRSTRKESAAASDVYKRLVYLEIVRMEGRGLMPKLLPLHFRYVTPWLGSLIARDREAYTYLPKSVENFLSATELDQAMRDSGLQNIRHKKLGLGTVAIHIGEKP